MPITHAHVSALSDNQVEEEVGPDEWNEDHVVTGYALDTHGHSFAGGRTYASVIRNAVGQAEGRRSDGSLILGAGSDTAVWQATLDAAGNDGGGFVDFREEFTISGSSLVPRTGGGIVGEGGMVGLGTNAPRAGGPWLIAGSALSGVVNAYNVPGTALKGFGVDLANAASVGIQAGVWQQRVDEITFRDIPVNGIALRSTGGAGVALQYADFGTEKCRVFGGSRSGTKGLYVQSAGPEGPSDGTISDWRIFGVREWVDIEGGGWIIRDMHIVGNTQSTCGIRVDGKALIENCYLDSCGSGPLLHLNGNRFGVKNLMLDNANMATNNTFDGILLNAGTRVVDIDGVIFHNFSNGTTYRYGINLGASPLNRAIRIRGIQSVSTGSGVNPFGTAAVGAAGTTYLSDMAGYSVEPPFAHIHV